MSETFNFKRFWTFYRYDLARIWKYNGKPLLFMGCAPILIFLFWSATIFSLSLEFYPPYLPVRIAGFFITLFILQLYLTKIYGIVTDKKKGPEYILIPASVTEKYISLMINILVVIPISFAILFMITDALVCLIPNAGAPMITTGIDVWSSLSEFFAKTSVNEEMAGFIPTFTGFYWMVTVSIFYNFLFFVFCSIVFKKLKILWGIIISSGIGTVMSLIYVIILGFNVSDMQPYDQFEYVNKTILSLNTLYIISTVFCAIGTIVLAYLIFRRLRKISH